MVVSAGRWPKGRGKKGIKGENVLSLGLSFRGIEERRGGERRREGRGRGGGSVGRKKKKEEKGNE